MRSADPAWPPRRCAARGLLAALLALGCAALGACASLNGRVVDEPIGDETRAPGAATPSAGGPGSGPAKPSAAGPTSLAASRSATAASGGGAPTAAPVAPVDPAIARDFGAALHAMQLGHSDEAEKRFIALTRSHPDLGGPHANLGIIYRRSERLAAAIAELEYAVRCDPAQPAYWNQLGIAYREQGQFAKARTAYEKAIGLDAGYAAANLNLGILFDLYLWDGNRALALYDRYLALTPSGNEQVRKWVADLKNRNRAAGDRKEQQ